MATELQCAFVDKDGTKCPEKVIYDIKRIPGLAARKTTKSGSKTVVVYLKCPKGHQERYEIQSK